MPLLGTCLASRDRTECVKNWSKLSCWFVMLSPPCVRVWPARLRSFLMDVKIKPYKFTTMPIRCNVNNRAHIHLQEHPSPNPTPIPLVSFPDHCGNETSCALFNCVFYIPREQERLLSACISLPPCCSPPLSLQNFTVDPTNLQL